MNYKKNLFLSTLSLTLLFSGLTFSMNFDQEEEQASKKIKLDLSTLNLNENKQEEVQKFFDMGNFNFLPNEIKKVILDYLIKDRDIANLEKTYEVIVNYDPKIKILINLKNLKLISKGFNNFLKINYKENLKKISKILILMLEESVTRNNIKNIKQLIQTQSIDINQKGKYGTCETILNWALKNDQEDLAKLLIKQNVDVNIKDKDGVTPLMVACDRILKEIVELMLKKNTHLDDQDKYRWTALMYATENDNLEIVKLLIKAGARVNIKNKKEQTAPKIAQINENKEISELLQNALVQEKNTIKLKIEQNTDINTKDINNATLLMIACQYELEETIKLLIERKINLNEQDNWGYTALMYATEINNIEIVKLLIEAGAKVKIQNNDKKMAYNLARGNEQMRDIIGKAYIKEEKENPTPYTIVRLSKNK